VTITCNHFKGASADGIYFCRDCLRSRAIGTLSTIPNVLLGPRREEAIGILMYHRVANHPRGVSRPTWNVTPRRFTDQMEGLLRRGFDPWPLRKVLEYRSLNRMIPRNVFVVTFDDAYANVYFSALPTLVRLKIPATVFVPTAYLDSTKPLPFDDWMAEQNRDVPPETWLPMTTDQCHELLDTGLIDLGAHTHTHRDFRGRPVEFRDDLAVCVSILQTTFGVTSPTFAFPFGSRSLGYVDDALIQAAREVGVSCGLSSESKLVETASNPFSWGRFMPEAFDSAGTLAAKLNGWHDAVRAVGRGAKALSRVFSRSQGK